MIKKCDLKHSKAWYIYKHYRKHPNEITNQNILGIINATEYLFNSLKYKINNNNFNDIRDDLNTIADMENLENLEHTIISEDILSEFLNSN